MSTYPIEFVLPPELIAQEPCEPRDHARLLVACRHDRSLRHQRFHELPHLLHPGDLLILNDTRVVPARLIGKRAATGGKWEGLFLREVPPSTQRKQVPPCWELLCQTRGALHAREIIDIEPGPLRLQLLDKQPDGRWHVQPLLAGATIDLLQAHGQIPLPPYIRKGAAGPSDRERYQTIYARQAGAVAAPTAGLHFTERVFAGLRQRGIAWACVTLHVGLATFQPIQVDDYTKHPMHAEWGCLPEATAAAIQACKARGGRVIAVGTTSVRVLESAASSLWRQDSDLAVAPPTRSESCRHDTWSGETDLFIHPPYPFKIVDALITNFHLPRTTLLLLIAAFAGVELTRQAYETAIAERYRFYSYGDAMLILP